MKFNCGHSYEKKIEAKEEWHKWFAWHPVRIGENDCRWLELVERRGEYFMGISGRFWSFEYRSINP